MTEVMTPQQTGQEAFLLGLVSEYQRIMEQVELGDTHVQAFEASISHLHRQAAEMFMGQAVTAEPLVRGTRPITATFITQPHIVPFRGFNPGGVQAPQQGILLREHPRRAIGTVRDVILRDAQLIVCPRRLSPYAWDGGVFLVNLLDEAGQPQVRLDLGFNESIVSI